ncbi:FecCD family ABC transporter permease [Nocardia sp. NPDC059180]|uniref:FecCD family ABC transporter permease n=1 Tax=Nocardia sp. NPDC059180 TaxID=3346761 RepID=UPI00368447D3
MTARIDFGRKTVQVRSRLTGFTGLLGLRTVVVCVALLVVALLVAVLALGTGDAPIPTDRVLRAIFIGDQRFDRLVVWEWRFPRVLLALVLGAALGVSGAILQSVTRNPLGSPDIVGFGTGAYTGALIVMLVFGGGEFQTAAGALVGGLASAVAIQMLALRHDVSGFRLILVGIGISAMLASVNAWLILRADLLSAMGAAAWGMGSLSGLTWAQVTPAIVLLTALSLTMIPLASRLRMLELGDDLASSFGIQVRRTRLLLIFLSVALTAVATAVTGPIAFIALAAPQLGRRLARTPSTALLPAAAMGALLLVTSDWLAQRLFAPTTLPVGVVTVSIGGLYLAYVLVAEARRS